MAHLVLSQSKQLPFFKYFPSLQEIHFLVVLHYLQSELQGSTQEVGLVSQVAHWVLLHRSQDPLFKYLPSLQDIQAPDVLHYLQLAWQGVIH